MNKLTQEDCEIIRFGGYCVLLIAVMWFMVAAIGWWSLC